MKQNYFADITQVFKNIGILKENEQIVGFIDSAILLERTTEKGYSYRIADPINFKTYHLTSRKSRLPSDRHNSLKEKVMKWGEFHRAMPLLETDVNIRADKLLEIVFKDILPCQGMSFREEQLKLSKAMLKALQEHLLALCEAEVGTGKTHAYILAVAIRNLFTDDKRSTIIATSTIALQKALTEEYIPSISEILTREQLQYKDLKFVLRKGKGHYVCDKKLNAYILSIVNHEDKGLVTSLQKLKQGTNVIDLDLYSFTRYVKERISVTNCDKQCGYKDFCRYQAFLQKCRHHFFDFQIVNHNYLIADLLLKKRSDKRLLSDFGTIIIDEAHKFPDAVRDMYGLKLYEAEIPVVLNRIKKAMGKSGKSIKILEKEYGHLIEMITSKYQDGNIIEFSSDIIYKLHLVIVGLKELRVHSEVLAIADKHTLNTILIELDKLINKLMVFTSKDEWIVWAHKMDEKMVLSALSKDVSLQIASDLWDSGQPIIMTSGTISVHGDFSYLEHISGIRESDRKVMKITTSSPFDYRSQALLYLPKHLPSPKEKKSNYLDEIILEIEKLIITTYGHTLILFTSYKQMELVFLEIQKKNLPFPLFIMGKGDMNIINKFRNSKNGILFASDSAGEGIDLAGDILSSLIVVKLPFPIPTAVSAYELKKCENFEDYLRKEIIPNMIIKLRQWIGRGVRRENDTCVFSILDTRAGNRYLKEITSALPPIGITHDLCDVEQFIKNKKDKDYFAY